MSNDCTYYRLVYYTETMTTLIDIYNGILKYNNNDIVIVVDEHNMAWFYAKQIIDILEYKNSILLSFNQNNKSNQYRV